MNGVPDDMKDNLKYLDVLGSPETYNHYSIGWAFAFNTPYKMFKRHTWEGGVRRSDGRPLAGRHQGQGRDPPPVRPLSPTSCRPCTSALGIEPPEVVKGYAQWDLEGTSFKYSFDDAKAKTQKPSQYYVMLGTRAIWRDGWKADAVHAGAPSGWGHFARGQVGAVPRRRGPLRDARPRRQAPGAPQGADGLVALRGRPALRAPARRPDRVGGADHAATADEPRRAIGTSTTRARSRCRKRSP